MDDSFFFLSLLLKRHHRESKRWKHNESDGKRKVHLHNESIDNVAGTMKQAEETTRTIQTDNENYEDPL